MSINPLLNRVKFPGETFQIPSKGIFYTHDELAPEVKNGEVHVFPMTTIDELQMKSPDLLFSGKAISDVFARCIPQVTNASQMFAKDIDFLIICLRKVSYGDTIELTYNHECQKDEEGKNISKNQKYTANITDLLKNSTPLDATKDFKFTLPNEQVVTMNPIRFGDFVLLSQKSAETKDKNLDIISIKDSIFDVTSSLIQNVDGIEDREFIREWLNAIKATWMSSIRKAIDETADWGPSYEFETECKECNKNIKIRIPLNPIYFFTAP